MMEGKKGHKVVQEFDSYANMAGETKKEQEIIDVDTYVIKNMNVPDSCSQGEVVEVDSYVNNAASVKKSIKRDLVEALPSSMGNTAAADGCVMPREGDKEVKLVREAKVAKVVTRPKKAPVTSDELLPIHVKNKYYVMQMGDDIYDAMLTKTNLVENSNEFYMIQVLGANNGDSYMLYNRWGRVGEKGQIKLTGPFSTCHEAVQEFEEKFYEKTRNHWSDRKKFVSYPKCHTWLEIDYSDKVGAAPVSRGSRRILDPRVEKFMSLICNLNMMTKQMTDIGYNAEKLPLKNLSKSTIKKGYEVLKLIADVMDQCEFNLKLFEDLSGEFYTIIPHDFGDKNMCEFVINTPKKLRSKLEMVEALGGIEEATKLLAVGTDVKEDALYAQYEFLNCKLVPVEANSKEFIMIEQYVKNTWTPDAYYHSAPGLYNAPSIVHIFRVSRGNEADRFKKYACMKNRMLLWHGSGLTNWISILTKGLRIAPPEAPLTGSSFGRGIYFADMFAKSSMYCFKARTAFDTSTSSSATGAQTALLLLCEVALGEMQELLGANHKAHQLPAGKQSTKGLGNTAPSQSQVLEDGVIVPNGKPEKQKKGDLAYNEYVVYNEDQVRMRYIVQVEFISRR